MLNQNIKVQVQVKTWKEAIAEAGALLVTAGSCTQDYVGAMIEAVMELGPYMVLTPHVALAHSRPSQAVKKSDISLVVLKHPIKFNHEAHDPVKLVFAFCATSSDEHVALLEQLATYLSDSTTVEHLVTAKTVPDLLKVLNKQL